ncbi:ribosome recycling factor [Clostridia bacterium]|nr:ribosome recycling factor [Clostridia bacterium]
MSISKAITEAEERMKKGIDAYKHDLSTIRTGRANPSILEGIMVDYYGVPTPINQVGNISAPEPRMLVVQPWDKTAIADIEKAIMAANIGINPANDGQLIRLPIPQLTEERRKELVKQVHKKGEDFKVEIRNIRRQTNDALKKLMKTDGVSEDAVKNAEEQVQEITKTYSDKIDEITKVKEASIMQV